jgi:hypothetical protein
MPYPYLEEFSNKYLSRCGRPLETEIISDGNCYFHSLEYANADCELDPLYRDIIRSRENIYDRLIGNITGILYNSEDLNQDQIDFLNDKLRNYEIRKNNKYWSENEVVYEGCLYKKKDILLFNYDELEDTCFINVIRSEQDFEKDFDANKILIIINITHGYDAYHYITYERENIREPILLNDLFIEKINKYRHTRDYKTQIDKNFQEECGVITTVIFPNKFDEYNGEIDNNSPLSNILENRFGSEPFPSLENQLLNLWGPKHKHIYKNKGNNLSPRTKTQIEEMNKAQSSHKLSPRTLAQIEQMNKAHSRHKLSPKTLAQIEEMNKEHSSHNLSPKTKAEIKQMNEQFKKKYEKNEEENNLRLVKEAIEKERLENLRIVNELKKSGKKNPKPPPPRVRGSTGTHKIVTTNESSHPTRKKLSQTTPKVRGVQVIPNTRKKYSIFGTKIPFL